MKRTDRDRLKKVDPWLVVLWARVNARRPDVGVAQGARTLAESVANVAKGASQLKDPKNSKHIPNAEGYATAIDFFLRNADGSANWSEADYPPVVATFKEEAALMGIKIVCGLDWKKPDMDHVELA